MATKRATKKSPGRPKYDGEPLRPRMVYITDAMHKLISDFGDGNFSEGIRKLVTKLPGKKRNV